MGGGKGRGGEGRGRGFQTSIPPALEGPAAGAHKCRDGARGQRISTGVVIGFIVLGSVLAGCIMARSSYSIGWAMQTAWFDRRPNSGVNSRSALHIFSERRLRRFKSRRKVESSSSPSSRGGGRCSEAVSKRCLSS